MDIKPVKLIHIQGGPKNLAQFLLNALTLSNINRFSKSFHSQNQEKICYNTITKDPTTPQVCRYTTLWNAGVLKATIAKLFGPLYMLINHLLYLYVTMTLQTTIIKNRIVNRPSQQAVYLRTRISHSLEFWRYSSQTGITSHAGFERRFSAVN